MNYGGKVVVITGGAKGIGKGIALAYAEKNAKVIIVDVDEQAGNEGAKELGVQFLKIDLKNPQEIHHLMKTVQHTYGRIDILINNAGVSRFKPLFELSVEEWDDIIDTNLRSVFLCSKEAAVYMKEQGGAIINIASTRAFMSEPNSEAYAATKGGIVALTHALAISLGEFGIRVNSISPGWIQNENYDSLSTNDHNQHPARRVGKPADIGRACLFLSHPENDFITGENVIVDGGMTKKMVYEE
ncbi:SDR family oxidoreductase [Cytobacillus spongiae]|jgi:NAD(P)-dependent dehydrogenase (short-subunit alcohol dehydrogenase family)|uniref:SDR family oxidoreductase n=1 Tax=Cytobacillus spongiae TaxID=2901381 RepID=UPI001F3F8C47|nr:SDR family oxidoreductase [Cytobacillus spongiae]UII56300.1 SDR family oxidoreductase [Cytobacillus spongiae]